MTERTAVVTPDEMQLYRELEATSTFDPSVNSSISSDPRLLPGYLIGYTAQMITAAEDLTAYHHGQPPASIGEPRRIWSKLFPTATNQPRYTLNDLLVNPRLRKPPITMESQHGPLPASEFAIKAGEYLLGFAATLHQEPDIDETSIENKLIYKAQGVDAAEANIVAETSRANRDPLAISLGALLWLQQKCTEVYHDKGNFNSEGKLDLPTKLTTTTHDYLRGIVATNTRELSPSLANYDLKTAFFLAWKAKQANDADETQ